MARPDRNVRQEHLAIDNPSVSRHLISLLAAERDRVPPPSEDGWASLSEIVARKNWDRPAGERLKLLVTPNERPAFAAHDSPWWTTARVSRAAAVIFLLLSVGVLGFGIVSAAGFPIPIPSFPILNLPLIGNSPSTVQGTVQAESGNTMVIATGKSTSVQVSVKPGTLVPPIGSVVSAEGHKNRAEMRDAIVAVLHPGVGQQGTPTPAPTEKATGAASTSTPVIAVTPYSLTPLTDATPGGLSAIFGRTSTPVPTAAPTPTRLPLSWGGSLPITAPPPPRPVMVPAPIGILPLPSNIGIPATPPVVRPNTPANGVTGPAGAAPAASAPGVTGAPAAGLPSISQPSPLGGRGTTAGSGTGPVATQPSQPLPAATPAAPGQGGRPSAGGGSDAAGGAASAAVGAGLLGVPVPTATSTSLTPSSAIPHPAQGGATPSGNPVAPANPSMLGMPAPSPAPVAPLTPPGQGGRPLGGGPSTGNGFSPSAAPGRGTALGTTMLGAGPGLLGLPVSIAGQAPAPPLGPPGQGGHPLPGGPDGAVATSAPLALPLGLAQAALPVGPVTHAGPSAPTGLTSPLTLLGLAALAPQPGVGPSLVTAQVIGIQLCPPSTTAQQTVMHTSC